MQPRTYKAYRTERAKINRKLMRVSLTPETIARAAKMLDIAVEDGQLLVDEVEMPAVIDSILHDLKTGDDKSILESYIEKVGGANEVQDELLRALAESKASLFSVGERDEETGTAELIDMLADRTVHVTDADLSSSSPQPHSEAIFCRILTLPGVSITSGMTLSFPENVVARVIRRHKEMMSWTRRKPPPSVSASFFRLYRTFGAGAQARGPRAGTRRKRRPQQ